MDETVIEQLKNYTVLCVEDEDGIRKRLVNTLKYYFKDVYEASNANDGYDLYLEYRPDLILSDIEMPDKNGIELIKSIRKNDLSTVVIMITAYSNEEYLLDLINLHINHYILKPINSNNLLNGIIQGCAHKLKPLLYFKEDYYFDMSKRELIFEGEMISLRERQKDFLILLYEYKESVLRYDQIEALLWRDKNMSQSALKTFIKELRQNLPIDLILNVPQLGYKLQKEL